MNAETAWFEDDRILDLELSRALRAPTSPIEIPGYADLRELARGGQGIVYTARQIGTRRTVAIKVMKDPPTIDDRARRRFEREVDLASGLRHPGIVRIYDSGKVADGRSYFVMELIDGVSIDRSDAVSEFARAGAAHRGVALSRVLRIFRGVVDAVHAAHQRGVIHRDLKPSNIRVDGEDRPHVLDFGLAKNIFTDGTEAIGSTTGGTGQFLGSLHWASPEQAFGKNDELDVRTDVYALGLILYHLVTGTMPYEVNDDPLAVLERIRNATPNPPSHHWKDIPADLDTIILRCIAKDPDRRYKNAADLDRDLELFSSGEPIEARRDSAWFTLRSAAKRYRRGLFVASAMLVVCTIALAVSIFLWRAAERARDTALIESNRSDKAMKFLIDMVRSVEPDASGQEVKMVELLDGISHRIDDEFKNDDRSRWLFRSTLAVVHERLARWDDCKKESQAAVDLGRRLFGPKAEETLVQMRRLGFMKWKTGDAAGALADLGRVRDDMRAVAGEDSLEYAHTLMALGRVKRDTGEIAEAESLFDEIVSIAQRMSPPNEELVAGAKDNLAAVAKLRGKPEDALAIEREALALYRKVLGDENTETLTALSNVIVYAMQTNRMDEAADLMKDAVPVFEKKYGPTHEDTLILRSNLAKLTQDVGRVEDATRMMEELVPIFEKSLGESSPRTLTLMGNLAAAYARARRLADAEGLQKKLLAQRRATMGDTRMETLIEQNNLANTLQTLKKLDEAEALFRDLSKKSDAVYGIDNLTSAIFRMNHAKCLMDLTRYAEAEPLLDAARSVIEKSVQPDHPNVFAVRTYLRQLYEATGRPEKAAAVP